MNFSDANDSVSVEPIDKAVHTIDRPKQKKVVTKKHSFAPKAKTQFLRFGTGLACTEPCAHPRCFKTCQHEMDEDHEEHY